MSLVAYDSSSEEEADEAALPAAVDGITAGGGAERKLSGGPAAASSPPPPPPAPNPSSGASSYHQLNSALRLPTPSLDQLPDAALLLASTSVPSHGMTGSGQSSRVAGANIQLKRESNGSVPHQGRSKYPRGHLPNLRKVDTTSSMLIPPQLSVRSNVVTEDISKLFVSRHGETCGE